MKIRISYEEIREVVFGFHHEIESLLNKKTFLERLFKRDEDRYDKLEWDIHLTSNSELKKEVRMDVQINREMREKIMTMSLPRFIWSAALRNNSQCVVTFLFDATDIKQGLSVLERIPYDDKFEKIVKMSSKKYANPQKVIFYSYVT